MNSDVGRGPILQVLELTKHFDLPGPSGRAESIRAVDGISLSLEAGETLGLVGESGSGKSTVARVLMGLESPTGGRAWLEGRDLFSAARDDRRRARRAMQIVFQDPYGSLDPRMKVGEIVAEPLVVHGLLQGRSAVHARVRQLLVEVGIDPTMVDRTPDGLSGGQRQRIGIARALALEPRVLILDEPVSALDVSVQAQVVELLRDLQERRQMSMLFIAHDLAVVQSLAHHLAVMYLGRIVEFGPADEVFVRPRHPYTRALISAVPGPKRDGGARRLRLLGEPPSPVDRQQGCPFKTRCWLRTSLDDPAVCDTTVPTYLPRSDGRIVACHFDGDVEAGSGRPALARGVTSGI